MRDTSQAPREDVPPLAASAWSPLRHSVFRALFIVQLASNLGTLMQSVGAAWLMGDLGASATLVALVQTATFMPAFLVGIPAGAAADMVDRRKLLVGTQAWMMVCAFTLAVLTFTDRVSPSWILALTFALGVGAALNGPAWMAIQPDLVPKREVAQAIALGSMTYNVGRAAGPALGGLVVAAAGPGWVFLLNGLSFVGTVLVLVAWRPAERPTSQVPLETFAGATRAGLRYGAHSPLLKTVLLRVVCIFFPAAAINALLPVVVRDTLDLGSGGYGLLLGCFGLGAVLAAVARPALERRASTEAQLLAASATLTVVLVVQGAVHQAAVVGAALFIAGFAWSSASTLLGVAAQSALPSWVRARGMALYLLALTGAIALGSALWGSLASWNLTGAHLIAAAAVGCGALAAWRWRISWSFDLDLTQVAGDAPEVAWVPEPTDGPVLVTVTYDVAPAKTIEFATLMRDMEDHRRRTGAYRWGLFRDVAEPDRFLETFVVDSWAEHLRQHHRTTVQISAFLELVSQHAVAERAVSHYISSSSPGALAPRERSPELADLREDGAEAVP